MRFVLILAPYLWGGRQLLGRAHRAGKWNSVSRQRVEFTGLLHCLLEMEDAVRLCWLLAALVGGCCGVGSVEPVRGAVLGGARCSAVPLQLLVCPQEVA